MNEVKTYCYEYQPLWKSIPIEPVEVGCGIIVDKQLGVYDERKGEGAVCGEVQSTSLSGAKMKVSRMFPLGGGKWKRSHLPRKENYFPCWAKDYQNVLYLWEKSENE